MVLVFARTPGEQLASLVKAIDGIIEQHPEKKINSYVNFLGDRFVPLKSIATEFAKKHQISHVPLVVPVSHYNNGPPRLKLHPDAHTTVIIYELLPGRVVKANHAIGKDGLDRKAIKAIVADIHRHLP